MKYKTQIKAFIGWYLLKFIGRHDTPRPSLWYPTDGWIIDPNEIIGEMAKDGFTFAPRENDADNKPTLTP